MNRQLWNENNQNHHIRFKGPNPPVKLPVYIKKNHNQYVSEIPETENPIRQNFEKGRNHIYEEEIKIPKLKLNNNPNPSDLNPYHQKTNYSKGKDFELYKEADPSMNYHLTQESNIDKYLYEG